MSPPKGVKQSITIVLYLRPRLYFGGKYTDVRRRVGGLLGLTEKSSSLVRHYKRTNGSGPSEVFLVIVLSRLIDTGLQKFANMEVSEQCDSNAERLMEMGPMEEDLTDLADLPTSLIVTNMEPGVFTNMTLRERFEAIFQAYDADATFQYLKSFRRVRVNFTTPQRAAEARIRCHGLKFGENRLACYFTQHVDGENNQNADPYLQPPLPYKQFLISPPASPPVGWEPVEESEPTINYDILSALANLAPGETHELHPQSEKHPGIIVHVCEQDEENALSTEPAPKIVQTSRPPLPCQQ
ncbi:calcipressin-1-like isoform X1 [Varroa destructor]|uniref:Uncharacterized protein n=1 Tax=Varroa destructor TaxID=109461 RepID=A0A7M7JIT6_VARDE|nr:calcipressin-1-like isoform X1 [Varroa destructor]